MKRTWYIYENGRNVAQVNIPSRAISELEKLAGREIGLDDVYQRGYVKMVQFPNVYEAKREEVKP